jgi:8-hydroxy-5-deazaflavin:NADPH oxidoreductase
MTEGLILTLAVLGGTGKQGPGLAYRWARAGYHVLIGSRTQDKAEATAAALNAKLGGEVVHGLTNEVAARQCDMAVLTVPYSAQRATLEDLRPALAGKVLVNVTVPLGADPTVVSLPPSGSASFEAQKILGPEVQVVAAFQNISSTHLAKDEPIACDVLVCGDAASAREQVLQLVKAAGMTGWDAGPLQNAAVVEGLTSVLLGLNKRHKLRGAGIRITGNPPADKE